MQKDFGIGTPLHEAVARGRVDVADVLLSSGADPNAKDCNGQSSIEMAEEHGKEDIVEHFQAALSDGVD